MMDFNDFKFRRKKSINTRDPIEFDEFISNLQKEMNFKSKSDVKRWLIMDYKKKTKKKYII